MDDKEKAAWLGKPMKCFEGKRIFYHVACGYIFDVVDVEQLVNTTCPGCDIKFIKVEA